MKEGIHTHTDRQTRGLPGSFLSGGALFSLGSFLGFSNTKLASRLDGGQEATGFVIRFPEVRGGAASKWQINAWTNFQTIPPHYLCYF